MAKNNKGNSEKQWLVQWKGFPASAQTWEPLENLSGCEAFIARFNEEREANERADLQKRKRTCSKVYMLIHKVRKGEIVCNWDDSVVQPQQTTPEVRAARANLRTALEDRFIKALPDHVFEQYSIATLLDPRLKSFRFLSQGQRDTAVGAFRAQWTQKWQPQHAEHPQPKPAAQKKTGLSAFLQDEFEEAAGRGVHLPDLQPDDELSAYMALSVESMQTNVIEWWHRHRTVFPNLSRMARQYLAMPATSAGVERLFSAAGLTFGDLAHAMKEETLGCRLLAAYNYTHALYCYP